MLRVLALALCAAGASGGMAQTYVLKNGATLRADQVRVGPAGLVETVVLPDGASYERGYPFADVRRIDVDEPPALDQAEPLLAAGESEAVLRLVEPVCREYWPFRAAEGSPWPRAARLRLQALLRGDDAEATTRAAREIVVADAGRELVGLAKLAFAQLDLRAGQHELARLMLEEVMKDASPAVEARVWLLRGELATARKAHEEALEAFLRVPAFFGGLEELMPAALLGAARSYRAYGDADRAERAALELIDRHPGSPEAAAAKREFGL